MAQQRIAKVVAGEVLRTNVHHRPYPTLMVYPGLNTRPYHDPSKFAFVRDFENNVETVKKEYL